MAELHWLGGRAALALLTILAVLAVTAAATRPPTWFGIAWLGAIAVVGVQGALGLIMLTTGAAPRDPTHLVYGFVAMSLLLLVPILTTPFQDRNRLRALAVAAVIVAAVAVRLLQTG